jgi:hypothetical protein
LQQLPELIRRVKQLEKQLEGNSEAAPAPAPARPD